MNIIKLLYPGMCYSKIDTQIVYLLGMRQKLVERMFVVFQTGHGHQETLYHLPGLPSVVGLRVGTL